MNETVPEEVLRETTKCPSGYSCLSNGSGGPTPDCYGCEVDFMVGKNLMFVKPKAPKAHVCPYKMHYGSGHVCLCPVRYYLFIAYPKP